ncbi:unnamed protein product, partial [Ectocarpus fasciculatus]
LLDWVADGNTLIQMTRGQTPVMTELGILPPPLAATSDFDHELQQSIEAHQRRGDQPDDRPGTDWELRWIEEGQSLTMHLREPRTFSVEEATPWTPTLLRGDRAYGGVLQHGDGRVVLVGAPTPALNHHLRDRDHLAWWLDQLGDGPVIFDEWAHGVGH